MCAINRTRCDVPCASFYPTAININRMIWSGINDIHIPFDISAFIYIQLSFLNLKKQKVIKFKFMSRCLWNIDYWNCFWKLRFLKGEILIWFTKKTSLPVCFLRDECLSKIVCILTKETYLKKEYKIKKTDKKGGGGGGILNHLHKNVSGLKSWSEIVWERCFPILLCIKLILDET